MKRTTLCYIEKDDCYLMLHRIKKKNDLNEGKWIGVGGHIEPGESPEECIRREVTEETGLTLGAVSFRGVIDFISDRWPDEAMYLYTSDDFTGTLTSCDEGVLEWLPKSRIFDVPLWEGDKIFLDYLLRDEPFFHLRLHYDEHDELLSSELFPSVVLASASPRRFQLLKQIGISPVVLESKIEEHTEETEPALIVASLSQQKAAASACLIDGRAAVIGSDTIVTIDGRVLGKPATHEEAADMIRSLQGRTHEVYTGVTILFTDAGEPSETARSDSGRIITFAEKTEVRVAPMTEKEILTYAGSEEPMDKAGAYGIQGPFAAFIEGINGDYNNVVGLPVGSVYRALRNFLTD